MSKNRKHTLYIALWVITGILLGILIGGLIEYVWLYYDLDTNTARISIYGLTIITGIIFSYWVGPKAWEKIYIDGARGKKYVSTK